MGSLVNGWNDCSAAILKDCAVFEMSRIIASSFRKINPTLALKGTSLQAGLGFTYLRINLVCACFALIKILKDNAVC